MLSPELELASEVSPRDLRAPSRGRARELCGAGPRAAGRRPLMPLCSPCLYSLLEVLALRQCGLRAGAHLYTLPGKRVSWLGEL